MKELLEYMARQLVDDPTAVFVEEVRRGDRVVLHLRVADGDMGRVIGKQGRIASAMRALVKVAATQQRVYATVEIG
ncbi:MAG: KH domain-containing protein [Dehalococcoidia bacterium]